MFESRIAADRLTVTARAGFAPEIDALAPCNLAGHTFLRRGWYQAGTASAARTLVLRRGADGAVLAAIPTVAFGPAIARARKVPGAYWPLRSALIAPDCNVFELAHGLDHSAARALGPVWRIGPARADNPATQLLVEAAQIAKWTVLSRPAGTSWVIPLDDAAPKGNARTSVARKLRAGWRKLEALGTPYWRTVRGDQWNTEVFDHLARVEAESWIARATDGHGAKFLNPVHRRAWESMLADPVLAPMLSVTILMLDDRPIAFSFDLDDGPVRYGIAGTHVEDLKHCYIGKATNYRAMDDAIAAGQTVMDTGAGDSGYKREMGAVPGYDLVDLLFVRSRLAARMLARMWGPARPLQAPAHG